MQRILVIKLSALGDFVQAIAPFAAIRKHHPKSELILLTTPPFKELADALGFFDDIWLDSRPSLMNIKELWQLRQKLRSVDRIYDLQMVDRTHGYFCLLGPGKRPEWCGTAKGCSHYYNMDKAHKVHSEVRYKELLSLVGINAIPPADVSHIKGNIASFALKPPFALLVPGASLAHAWHKCWPIEGYAQVAQYLQSQGIQPIIIGGKQENNHYISQVCPETLDLTGKTSILDIIALAGKAILAIGNDTGPMHMAAMSGCPVITLFSGVNDPNVVGPRGPHYRYLVREPLKELPVQEVIQAVAGHLAE